MTGENQPVKAIFVKGVTISKKVKKALAFCRRYGIIYMFIFCHITKYALHGRREERVPTVMYDKVVEIIARQLQIDTDVIDEHTKIMEDLGADSLDVVEMLMAMEETFGFSIPDEDIEELITVSDIVEYVESNMEN